MIISRSSKGTSVELFDIDKGYTVFSRSDYRTRKHSHYAIEIVCSTEGTFNVKTDHATYTNLKNAIIPSNLVHTFSCINASCNLLFLDPLSKVGRYFVKHYQLNSQEDILVNISELNNIHKNGKFDIPQILSISETTTTEDLDYRICNCIQAIDSITVVEKITLSQLSEVSFLSEGRLSHLFKEQLGISVHQYILWKKMLLAVQRSREGHSLTACAHAAGFTDSSHFTKAFYNMFGIKPFFALKG